MFSTDFLDSGAESYFKIYGTKLCCHEPVHFIIILHFLIKHATIVWDTLSTLSNRSFVSYRHNRLRFVYTHFKPRDQALDKRSFDFFNILRDIQNGAMNV